MCARMYDDVRADVQMSWTRMYSRFAWVYTDVRADVQRSWARMYSGFAWMYADVLAAICTSESHYSVLSVLYTMYFHVTR